MNTSSNIKKHCFDITEDCLIPHDHLGLRYEDLIFDPAVRALEKYKKEILNKAGVSEDLHEEELKLSSTELLEKYPEPANPNPECKYRYHSFCLVGDVKENENTSFVQSLTNSDISLFLKYIGPLVDITNTVYFRNDYPTFTEDSFGTGYLIETCGSDVTVIFKKEYLSKLSVFNFKSDTLVASILNTEHPFLSFTLSIDRLRYLLSYFAPTDKENFKGALDYAFTLSLSKVCAQYYYDNKTFEYFDSLEYAKLLPEHSVGDYRIKEDSLVLPSMMLQQMVFDGLKKTIR